MKRHNTRVLGTAFNGVEHLLLGDYILPEESEKAKQEDPDEWSGSYLREA